MHSLYSWSLLALAAGVLPVATTEWCNPPLGTYGYMYYVESQSGLDEIADHCTTVNGTIVMAYNYTDSSFYLPKVRNITGSLQWEHNLDYYDTRPSPATIDLPDLEELGSSMYLNGLPTLRNISMPKLETQGWELHVNYVHEADFRSLETGKYITITGNISTLRLDALRDVSERLLICNMDLCGPDNSPASSLDISLLSLESAGSVSLQGRISSLEVPALTRMGDGSGIYNLEFSSSGGPTINLTFPRLTSIVRDMIFTGDIGGFAMPNLRKMSETSLLLTTFKPLAVNLPFDAVNDILLRGNISSVELPNLHNLTGYFTVDSDLPLDCDSILDTISTATNVTASAGGKLHCTSSAAWSNHTGRSTTVKLAIAVMVLMLGWQL